jgi:opacity protein-like surface antigen
MGTVNFGYRIADGTAIEFAVDFKPKYPMTIIADKDATAGPMKTKANAKIYMINVVYDFAKFGELQPYFTAGLGIADIRIKPGVIYFNASYGEASALVLEKNNRIALAFQMGVGAKYPITEAVSFDTALKLQGITNVKLKYQKRAKVTPFDMKHKSTKQHLGVAEAVAGFVFNF